MRKIILLALPVLILAGVAAYAHTSGAAHDHPATAVVVRDGGSRPDPDARPVTVGGPFTLVDQNGRTVTEKDFLGKYLIVFFGFTYCPDICPTELQTALDALSLLPSAQAAKVQPVFISIDPERDTPPVMKEYLNQFGGHIIGLTGTDAQIATVARAYKVYYNRTEPHEHATSETGGDDDYMMDHSSFLYLMGPDGAFIKVFPSGTDVDQLAADLKTTITP